jgi:hypothetical protein
MHKALIEAAAPAAKELLHLTGEVKIEAAAAGDKPGPRRFDMVAYTGGKLFLANFDHPVVVDLEGVSGTEKSRPIFKDHNKSLVVGHTDRIVNDGRQLTAAASCPGPARPPKRWSATTTTDFPGRRRSAPAPSNRIRHRRTAGDRERADLRGAGDRRATNPAQRDQLRGLGRRRHTSARIAANAAEGAPMTFEQWLASKEIAADGLSDAVKNRPPRPIRRGDQGDRRRRRRRPMTTARRARAARRSPPRSPPRRNRRSRPLRTTMMTTRSTSSPSSAPGSSPSASASAALAKIEATYEKRVPAEKFAEITAKAIEDDWDADKLELELIRAERPPPQRRHGGGNGPEARRAGDRGRAEPVGRRAREGRRRHDRGDRAREGDEPRSRPGHARLQPARADGRVIHASGHALRRQPQEQRLHPRGPAGGADDQRQRLHQPEPVGRALQRRQQGADRGLHRRRGGLEQDLRRPQPRRLQGPHALPPGLDRRVQEGRRPTGS